MPTELILGGQKSGKSGCAEARAARWLAAAPDRSAVLLATALAGDEEMRERIRRHRQERAERVPGLQTLETPDGLSSALRLLARPDRLLVIDCLTLWLTQLMLPLEGEPATDELLAQHTADLLLALRQASGPVVCVSNEIGLGVSPLGAGTRRFVDALGRLHQALAAQSDTVVWMVAGLELQVKPSPATCGAGKLGEGRA